MSDPRVINDRLLKPYWYENWLGLWVGTHIFRLDEATRVKFRVEESLQKGTYTINLHLVEEDVRRQWGTMK